MFKNRKDAGQKLIELIKESNETLSDFLVIAIPRGGVPIARQIANEFGLPLRLIPIQKVSSELNPELAIGAISLNDSCYLNNRFSSYMKSYPDNKEIALNKLKTKVKKFKKEDLIFPKDKKKVLIVDDGIATGCTMNLAINILKERNLNKLYIATPVADISIYRKIKNHVDKVYVVKLLKHMNSVSDVYEEFDSVEDIYH